MCLFWLSLQNEIEDKFFGTQSDLLSYLCVMYSYSSIVNCNKHNNVNMLMGKASVDILVIFVGRSISFGRYVVQYQLWDCRMEHVVLEAKKCSVSIPF
jgi:hypothetical protein